MKMDQQIQILMAAAKKSGSNINIVVAENAYIGTADANAAAKERSRPDEASMNLEDRMYQLMTDIPSPNKLEAVMNLAKAAAIRHSSDGPNNALEFLGLSSGDSIDVEFIPGKTCECGCGKPVKPGNRYIRGHSNKNRSVTKSRKVIGHVE
jgi:hypothetical protein